MLLKVSKMCNDILGMFDKNCSGSRGRPVMSRPNLSVFLRKSLTFNKVGLVEL